MALVNITVQNDDPSNTKISGLIIYIYTTGAVFVTSATTNAQGLVTVNLPDASYDVLFFKQGVTITQPQRLVIDSMQTNNFLITGHVRVLPESLDTTLCRVSGFINGLDGKPVPDLDVRFNQLPTNIINTGVLIFNDPVNATSNNRGYFEFDLLRTIKYEAGLSGYATPLVVKVADVPAVKVNDLLFPLQVNLSTSDDELTIPLSGGANSSLTYTVTYSDFNTGRLYNDWSSIEVNYSVPGIAYLSANDTNLVITPKAAGTTVLTFVRVIKPEYVWINPPAFVSPTITINVT